MLLTPEAATPGTAPGVRCPEELCRRAAIKSCTGPVVAPAVPWFCPGVAPAVCDADEPRRKEGSMGGGGRTQNTERRTGKLEGKGPDSPRQPDLLYHYGSGKRIPTQRTSDQAAWGGLPNPSPNPNPNPSQRALRTTAHHGPIIGEKGGRVPRRQLEPLQSPVGRPRERQRRGFTKKVTSNLCCNTLTHPTHFIPLRYVRPALDLRFLPMHQNVLIILKPGLVHVGF